MFGRKSRAAASASDPLRVTEQARLTGTCNGPRRHTVTHVTSVTRDRWQIRAVTAEVECPGCGRLATVSAVVGG